MATIKLVPSSQFSNQLKTGSSASVMKQIVSRVTVNASNIRSKIADFIVGVFNNSDVALSLRGQGVDLPAHFGLTDDQASSLADGMAQLIRDSVKIIVSSNNKIFVNILAVSTDWEKYVALPGGEYVSNESGITIPVVRWMLLDPNIDIGQAAYSIEFDGNKTSLKNSRSGRAVMVSLLGKNGNTPYVLPAIIQHKAGENFIEYSIGQPGVAEKVIEIVLSSI